MQGRIVSMCAHPRRSRGPAPCSTQRRLGRTGDICWVKPGPTLHSNPRTAVAILKHTPHCALGDNKFQVQDVMQKHTIKKKCSSSSRKSPLDCLWFGLLLKKIMFIVTFRGFFFNILFIHQNSLRVAVIN